MTQTVAKIGDQAPTAAVCCSACRTCLQTNLIAAGLAAAIATDATIARLLRRVVRAG